MIGPLYADDLHVDPLSKCQPDNTAYKINLNNPNIFMDPDGRREFLTISYYEDGKLVRTENVTLTEKYHYVQGFDSDGDKIDRYYDIYHNQRIDLSSKNKTITITNESTVLSQGCIEIYSPWGSEFAANSYRNLTDWSSVRGGKVLTSAEGGFNNGKSNTINADEQTINIDVLLTTLSSLGGVEVPKILEQSVLLKSIMEKAIEVRKNAKKEVCTEVLCDNTKCERNVEAKVKQKPNTPCTGGTGWHGRGKIIEVDCKKQNNK